MRWNKKILQNGRLLITGLLILNVVLYLGAVTPIRNKVQDMHQEFNHTRHQVLDRQLQVKQLQAANEKLSEAQLETGRFFYNYLYPRRSAYSQMSRVLQTIAEKAGVELGQITYTLSELEEDSLRHLSARATVVGSWNAELEFLHLLERAENLILVNQASLLPSNYPGLLNMQVNLGVYLRP